jgi:hypothetical protein
MPGWSVDEAGQVSLCPLVGYIVNTISAEALCVRLEFIRSKEQVGEAPDAVQLVMRPTAAKELVRAIEIAISRTRRLPGRKRRIPELN